MEEEFFLLRPDGRTADVAPVLLADVAPGARAVAEFARCQVESTTGVCTELSDVGSQLATSRRILARAAADHGALLAPLGTPPVGAPGRADLSDDDRYRRLVSEIPGVTGEEITCAGQVHVAVASRDVGAAVLARMRPWLPILLALTANSPLWRGRDTGWSSHRFVVQRRWPSFRPPPQCTDAAGYDASVAELVDSRGTLDDRGVYFWARLSPRHPTVEIRIADTCLTVADAVLLTGLCRALVTTAVADEAAGRAVPDVSDRELWAAASATARRGLSAVLLVPSLGGWVPAPALLRRLLATLLPALDAAGDRALVERLLAERLRRGSGADRQQALWRRSPAGFARAVAGVATGSQAGI